MPEKSQSLESQLKMARPKRAEVKRVPLTPEEKKFLGEIMDKAVAAEKAGELEKALGFYTDYKNELLKIKERKESQTMSKQEIIEKARKGLIDWVKTNLTNISFAKFWVNSAVEFDEDFPGKIIINSSLSIENEDNLEYLPENLYIIGDLSLKDSKNIIELPEHLEVNGDLDLRGLNIKSLPQFNTVNGKVYVSPDNKALIKSALEALRAGRVLGIKERF